MLTTELIATPAGAGGGAEVEHLKSTEGSDGLGGGGGGGGISTTNRGGASGGNGIVIIRRATADSDTASEVTLLRLLVRTQSILLTHRGLIRIMETRYFAQYDSGDNKVERVMVIETADGASEADGIAICKDIYGNTQNFAECFKTADGTSSTRYGTKLKDSFGTHLIIVLE